MGKGWPTVDTRHEMFSEAIDIISGILDSDGAHNYYGKRLNVDTTVLWDKPETRGPIGIAVSGRESCRLAGKKGDIMIATEPKPELGEMFDEFGGEGKPRVGQIAVAYDTDRDRAVKRVRWSSSGGSASAGR